MGEVAETLECGEGVKMRRVGGGRGGEMKWLSVMEVIYWGEEGGFMLQVQVSS